MRTVRIVLSEGETLHLGYHRTRAARGKKVKGIKERILCHNCPPFVIFSILYTRFPEISIGFFEKIYRFNVKLHGRRRACAPGVQAVSSYLSKNREFRLPFYHSDWFGQETTSLRHFDEERYIQRQHLLINWNYLPQYTLIASQMNAAVPSACLSMLFLKRSSAAYIWPRPSRISFVQR